MDGFRRLCVNARAGFVTDVGSVLGRVGSAGLGKAVDALDNLGSSLTNVNQGNRFTSAAAIKGKRIGILAFEVANTTVKGYTLLQSLSDESLKRLKEDILCSEGVQRLVSTDMDELLRISALDKRKELDAFAREVVRFGNQCQAPQWHQLNRIFEKLGGDLSVPAQTKEEAAAEMQSLMELVQHTMELYHELNLLDRLEAHIREKLQDENIKGEQIKILGNELRKHKKKAKRLKKISLWDKFMEEVVEKLVDIVYFLHQELTYSFGRSGKHSSTKQSYFQEKSLQELGTTGFALHYANIIKQIDKLVSMLDNGAIDIRSDLYHHLPPRIKNTLRQRLSKISIKDELSMHQVRSEMERILGWLVPAATNTIIAHYGFGWVGEWAKAGSEVVGSSSSNTETLLIQTLHHADQKITEGYILDLVVCLYCLVSLAKSNPSGSSCPVEQSDYSLGHNSVGDRQGVELSKVIVLDSDGLRGADAKRLTPAFEFGEARNLSTREDLLLV